MLMINKTDKTRIALMFHDSVDFWFNLSCDMLPRQKANISRRKTEEKLDDVKEDDFNNIKKSEEQEPQT